MPTAAPCGPCALAADATLHEAEVLGDGPAGWAVAIGLAQRGWRVAVRGGTARREPRIELLAASALSRLQQLGIGSEDLGTVARPCPGTWSCWGSGHAVCLDAVTQVFGAAWSVDRPELDALLRRRGLQLGVREAGAGRAPADPAAARPWQVLACGGVSGLAGTAVHDDRLIAFTARGSCGIASPGLDRRLLIEALPEGWAYGLLGPGDTAGIGFITDAQAVAGRNARAVACAAMRGSERIARLLDAFPVVRLAAAPIPCHWRPVRAGARAVRVGDAQASYDPITGRGLWEALYTADRVAAALHAGGGELRSMEEASRQAYRVYLAQRAAFYAEASGRFGTPFWARRAGQLMRLTDHRTRTSSWSGAAGSPP